MSTCPVLALIIIIIFHSVCNLNVYDSRNITIATFLWRISSDNLQKTKDQTPIIPSSPPIDSNSGQIEIGSSEVSDDAGNDDQDPIVKLEEEYEKGNLVRKRGKAAADTDVPVPESEVPLDDAYLRRTLCVERLKRADDFEIYLSGWR
jgi:hypothetical protein